MKRNFKKEVTALSEKLPAITTKQIEWAKEHCFSHYAYLFFEQLWCSDCGKIWIDSKAKKGDSVCCPYCHKELSVKSSRKRTEKEINYLIIATVRGDWQVLRHVFIERMRCTINGGEVYYTTREVYQQWSNTEGKIIIIARPQNYYSSTGWMLDKPMKIKETRSHLYNIYGEIYPHKRILPILQRNGLKSSFHSLCAAPLVRGLYNNPLYETLLKTKQYDILRVLIGRTYIRHEWSINICNRNNYIVRDADLWFDYLSLLDYFHLDTHNAHYVCPKNLKHAHDLLLKRKEKKEERERRERELRALMTKEQKLKEGMQYFNQHIISYMNLAISGDGIEIRPLLNVSQFYQEAKVMHHCVWKCHYYDHPDCLIMSARKDGRILETIEISLKTYSIIQSRAVCNGQSDYHEDILNLINKNMNLIRNCA